MNSPGRCWPASRVAPTRSRSCTSSGAGGGRAGEQADAAAPGAGPALWRPLLEVRRRDIDAYCAAWGLAPLHDATNDDLDLRRNAVRHAIVPALEAHFPNAIRAIARNARV